MTREDFFKLPIADRFGYDTRIIDGKKVVYPKELLVEVEFVDEDQPIGYRDDEGQEWRIVRMNGAPARQVCS